MVLWNHGTCSLDAKLRGCSAIFTCSSRRYCPTSYLTFIPARGWGLWVPYPRPMSAGVLQTAVSRRPRLDSVRLWAVGPECRLNTRSVFGLWALSVGSATPTPGQRRRRWRLQWATNLSVTGMKVFRILLVCVIGAARPCRLPCLWLLLNADVGRVRGQLPCLWSLLNVAVGRVKFQDILYGGGEAWVRAGDGRGWGRALPLPCGGLCRLSYHTRPAYNKGTSDTHQGVVSALLSLGIV